MLQAAAARTLAAATGSHCAHRMASTPRLPGAEAKPDLQQSPIVQPLVQDFPHSKYELIPPLEQRKPGPDSKRTGLIAIKVGMVSEWDEHGVLTPLTALWFDENQVTQVKVPPYDCTTALQIGCGSKKAKRLRWHLQAFYLQQQLPFKSKLAEFRVSPDALLPVGTALGAAHFIPGQHVDVQALTKGKGFAGVMKRHGFKGQPRTHGHSLSHRSGGAIGRQGISRVLPGQRMAGRMGGIKSVQSNCWVHRVDPQRNLLFVAGSLPGPQGCYLYVRDAMRKRAKESPVLPFPTFVGSVEGVEAKQAVPKKNKYDEYKD